MASVANELDGLDLAAQYRSVTGVLGSHPDSRDVHINALSISFYGHELLIDTTLELNSGRRYGLIGLNGCGKFMNCDLNMFRNSYYNQYLGYILRKDVINKCLILTLKVSMYLYYFNRKSMSTCLQS